MIFLFVDVSVDARYVGHVSLVLDVICGEVDFARVRIDH
jgi:hypothetical protein